MTKLLWDKVGERLYEAGLDHGVLYLENNSGVPWNGLVSVEEDVNDDTSDPVYFDGIKSLDTSLIGDFAAKLSAYTYPDEFMEYEGVEDLGNGLLVDNQAVKTFGLSYRTKVGNDTQHLDYGYKIHLVYNLTTTQDNTKHETFSETPNPLVFTWTVSAIPAKALGYRPTAHVMLDSRFLPSGILDTIENILYGYTLIDYNSYDGGTVAASGPNEIDGGVVLQTLGGANIDYDGGIPSTVGATDLDGGTPSTIGQELLDISAPISDYDGGTPTSVGSLDLNGGIPSSINTEIPDINTSVSDYDGGTPSTLGATDLDGGTPSVLGIEIPNIDTSALVDYDGGAPLSINAIDIDGGTPSTIGLELLDVVLTIFDYDGGVPSTVGAIDLDGGDVYTIGLELLDYQILPNVNAPIYIELPELGFVASEYAARLPSINELIQLTIGWGPKRILPQPITGIAVLISGVGDITQTNVTGVYYRLPSTRLVETAVPGFFTLVG